MLSDLVSAFLPCPIPSPLSLYTPAQCVGDAWPFHTLLVSFVSPRLSLAATYLLPPASAMFHTTIPSSSSRQTFMTGHAIYWGFQENFLEEKTGSPPPFIFTIYKLQSMQLYSRAIAIRIVYFDSAPELGLVRARDLWFRFLAFAITPK